ncbi:hypothetical protein DelCs14_1774 [Delftia sp. Cs1-4]|uniref:hypothetical protein n=1 Tax=Delftia sp. (strain Cs1-4) TaxID=742013 RepID=UPI00020E7BD1|nr:hypothetical protein [Delftia sp. Cs1-4]AEF88800.1 hypothetical protein DelCs14_1774 [Delftia sp. Cs1-4]
MSIESTRETPAYLLGADGGVVLNAAGSEADARYRAARAEREQLDRSWAGAILARLFLRHDWLEAVTLSFEATAEYDDGGGYYRCIRCTASAPRTAPLAALPEELSSQGALDIDAATALLEDELEDCAFDLYTGLAEYPEGYEDLTLPLERRAIAPLLHQCPFDGSLAHVAWGLAPPTPA